jgi:putative YhbY family RNA-binding protein
MSSSSPHATRLSTKAVESTAAFDSTSDMEPLEPAQRRALRARAHHLDPVVTIGHHGLTPAVVHEIDVALAAHELVKVRALGDDREAREGLIERICAELDCAPVQRIGKLLVLWRPKPREATEAGQGRTRGAPARKRPAAVREEAPAPRSAATAERGRATPASAKPPRGVPRAALPRRRRGA